MVKGPVVTPRRDVRRGSLVAGLATALMITAVVTSVAPASAAVQPKPDVVDSETLTRQQLAAQVKAAKALRADLMRSSTQVAAANARLEGLSAKANSLLADLDAARNAQVAAGSEAAAQRAKLIRLGVEIQSAVDSSGRLASDSYVRGGGALGDVAAILEAITAPSADQNTDTISTVRYLMDGRARVLDRLRSLRSEQVRTSARAAAASTRATAATKRAAAARSAANVVIVDQRKALDRLRKAQADQIARAARLRGAILRSEDAVAKATARRLAQASARRLAQALAKQDFMRRMAKSASCGQDSATYPNGQIPARALCPMYGSRDERLPRKAAIAFNAMSKAYQEETGSPLCVTDGYRPFAEQVEVRLASPGMTATPGKSKHGLGLAVDLCGGVQNFAAPAHLWMQRNASLYGWFHPAWAGPKGSMPEPWHWQFAS